MCDSHVGTHLFAASLHLSLFLLQVFFTSLKEKRGRVISQKYINTASVLGG